nr:MAG TPA_asm: hypothetical protein [Caudoviricetes sp.]
MSSCPLVSTCWIVNSKRKVKLHTLYIPTTYHSCLQ